MRTTLQGIKHLLHDTAWQYADNPDTQRQTTRGHPLALHVHDIHEATANMALNRKQGVLTQATAGTTRKHPHDI